ncbi:MAG: hypothetical protein COW00_10510 [Bdellovibrio sp. CG12_big_fil_rev_8_21_14_0_65_39_13]|nr:MAG: hypothetical protein COW78_05020 [Bdellovibrio sp. CG22_combo_CG10-13_8_21_14_all_39_27]PIQ59443.1 MAG: hypothetical protein COW00_10510 [Bdellovibrio sp. CG12_big_fil_rev_8_21_14_0_65_39_13]PIR33908.1 MAG: hypothetical protein COV37_14415 [Bdellovibrio sp. CG11_big_fil_rev_8_21_14_0_20_39_38]
MLSLVIIALTAFGVSLLTFFSGFGLGTILLPVFALWFPLEIAVAMTAIVHLMNNLFKFFLVRKFVNFKVVLSFGVPAIIAAFIGAILLQGLSLNPTHFTYELGDRVFDVTLIKLVMALIIIFFTLFELIPFLKKLSFSKRFMPIGGALSGFFGGLSGHQGALRSAFLSKLDLSKEQFVATGTVIACLVDLSRLAIYTNRFHLHGNDHQMTVVSVVVATLAAFAGAYIGSRVLKKITMHIVQNLVSFGLIVLAVLLGMGII